MIYFAQPKNGGPIRIGSSSNVDVRRRTLGTWLPGGVEIVLEIEGLMLGEGVLHHCFNPIRLDRDWFASCPAMWRFILDAIEERPSWVPKDQGDAVKLDIPALTEEFGGKENCFRVLGFKNLAGFEQAARYQTKLGYGMGARVVFQRLLRDGQLPDFIAALHVDKKRVAA